MKVTWFRHSHENRNDLLRFGLMRLHYRGQIQYIEQPFESIGRHGFTKTIEDLKDPRHISFLLVENGKNKIRVLVDAEDSFALITPLIAEVDVCFCCGYNTDFFEKQKFVKAYSWQTETDIDGYVTLLENKIKILGNHFGKVRKFVPIAPNQGHPVPLTAWKQKYKNLEHKLNRAMGRGTDFSSVYKGFQIREKQLNALRNNDIEYDIVLNDSLWGWPQHRINLHNHLGELYKKNYRIHSVLNYIPPVAGAEESYKNIDASGFPMSTAPIHAPYETMVAKSRLAVYACGFHWGWRNIMMLALQVGIPVLTDRLLTEAYFDIKEFKIFEQEDHLWASVEPTLTAIDDTQWKAWKLHNQGVYDKHMSPEAVASYFIQATDATPYPHEYSTSKTNKWKAPA